MRGVVVERRGGDLCETGTKVLILVGSLSDCLQRCSAARGDKEPPPPRNAPPRDELDTRGSWSATAASSAVVPHDARETGPIKMGCKEVFRLIAMGWDTCDAG